MDTAVFMGYIDGYYHFILNESEAFEFEEIALQVQKQFNLKDDTTLKGKHFEITFSEHYEDDDDLIIYKIESLKLL